MCVFGQMCTPKRTSKVHGKHIPLQSHLSMSFLKFPCITVCFCMYVSEYICVLHKFVYTACVYTWVCKHFCVCFYRCMHNQVLQKVHGKCSLPFNSIFFAYLYLCVYIYTCTHVYFQICGCDVCVGPSPRHTSRENEGRKPVLWIHEAHPVLPNHFSTNELYSSPRGQNWFQILRTFWIWRHKIPSEMAPRARLCRKNLQWNTHSPFKGGSKRLQLNWLSWEM